MKYITFTIFLTVSLVLKAELIPLEDFFKNPSCSSFSLSPDGKKIAWLSSWKKRMNIFYKNISDHKPRQLTHITNRDINGFYWEGNNHLVFLKDKDGDENFHLYSININSNKETDHTPFKNVKTFIVDDLRTQDHRLLIAHNKRDKKVFDVFELDIINNSLTLKAHNNYNFRSYITDHSGKIRAALSVKETTKKIFYRPDETQEFQEILSVNFPDSLYPLAFDFENKNLLCFSNINRDKMALILFDPAEKTEITELFRTKDADLSNILISDKNKKLLGLSWHTDRRKYHFFDKERAELQNHLVKSFPGLDPVLTDSDLEEENYIVAVYSDTNPVNYYLFNKENLKITLLGKSAPWIKPDKMSKITTYKYNAADKYLLSGYLSLPQKGNKPYPLVMIPHGGPEARDYWGFDRERQFLNNRGYAVLTVNFRGSTGFGKKHHSSGFKQWGKGIMQTDLSDGVQKLIEDGIADKKRIAIFGTSYGGYAALSGLTFQNNIYSCGISFCGPSNIFTLFETIPPYWEGLRNLMYKKIGNPITEKDFIKSISPLFHTDKIKVPLMIAQGKNDPRVKQTESDQIVNKLRAKGISIPYILKSNEGHGFMNEENIIEFYKCLEAFLAENLGGESSTTNDFLHKYQ